jgi:hypothetical protein
MPEDTPVLVELGRLCDEANLDVYAVMPSDEEAESGVNPSRFRFHDPSEDAGSFLAPLVEGAVRAYEAAHEQEPDRWLDQFLGGYIGPASRDELLAALDKHVYNTVVLQIELPDGTTLVHLHGTLFDTPVYDDDVSTDSEGPNELYSIGGHESFDETTSRAVLLGSPGHLRIPAEVDVIDQFTDGFRLHLPGDLAMAVVLWHDTLHVTETGDVAPGLGLFRVHGMERG